MATERTTMTPEGQIIFLDENKDAMTPNGEVISIEDFAAPTGAIINQLQGSNMGADLFNGTLI